MNYYPIPQAEYSNKRNRPIGLGVQGLAEWCFLAKVAYDSPEAISANREIFDTMYFAALTTSCDRARLYGSYPTYEGSPMSKGVLQFDMWSKKPWSNRWDWNSLRQMIAKHGVRNSLLLAPMPTASTSIHLGNTEAFEPQNSNMYTRTTLAGPHQVINRFLVRDLIALGLWTEEIRNMIISDNGSVQNIDQIPQELKQIYKTVWEIKQRVVLEMAADRGIYVDQSMSLNIHLDNPTYAKLTGLLLYAYELGLKTAMYYLRTKAKAQAQKFTIEPVNQKVVQSLASTQPDVQILDEEGPVCTMEEGCLTCGS